MDDDLLLAVRRRPRHRLWLVALLVVSGGPLIAVAQALWNDTARELRAVDDDLTVTAGDLDAAAVDLMQRHNTLSEERAVLDAAEADLARRTGERGAAEDRLIAVQGRLDETNGHIDDRTNELGAREANLALLNRCFVGASEALNQISVADTSGFARTLAEIGDICAAARSGP